MKTDTLILSEDDIKKVFKGNLPAAIDLIEKSLTAKSNGDVIMPDKISQIFDTSTQKRINCMPATLPGENVSGVKWVSVFPENSLRGVRNVSGMIILSELEHGFTKAVMDGTYITNLRTASVGAVAAKYLSSSDSSTIGFIGAGAEARMHLDMIIQVRPGLKKCCVSSRREATVEAFIKTEKEKHPELEFVNCSNDFESAVTGADIIVTATSTQAALLKAEWVKEGALYIHVGGWEDDFGVALKADKIICDEWEAVKHRSQTISLMYKNGLLSDADIYCNIADIVTGAKAGRESRKEFIYFCSVGLAYIDIMFADYSYRMCRELGLGAQFRFN